MELREYALLGERMRKAQKEFFRLAGNGTVVHSQKNTALDEAKRLGREFDLATKDILSKTTAGQPNLF